MSKQIRQEPKTKALATNNPKALWTKDQIALITRTVAKGATMDELSLFLYTANKVKLDPLAKQIYFSKYKLSDGTSQMAIITGIDGYRAVAERSGGYAGSDDVIYDGGKEYEPGKEPANPSKATITIYRIVSGQRVAYTATARWKEYLPGNAKKQFMWKKMPYLMLGKVAEALALRKAFPQDLSGLKIIEEMDQAESAEVQEVKEENKQIEQPKAEQFFCNGCDIEITKAEANYSTKLYKKPFCRECQKQFNHKSK